MQVAIVGGTRGIGRALARELAAGGHSLVLLGRDAEQVERSAADLRAHGAPLVATGVLDLARPEGFAPALDAADAAFAAAGRGGFDTLIVTAAELAREEQLDVDPARARRLLDVDFTATVLLCEEARRRLLARLASGSVARATLCIFGSVAGDRARKPAVLYGATKAGLAHYLDGIELRHRGQGLRVLNVKPGFVRTGMTQGMREPPFAADPEPVARRVRRALERGRSGVVYAPPIWWLVMRVIRLLPRPVMRRARF
jgi:NAD(P)-dependent dehydrogenase (short-subunit alcohol dehydrogenase family)